jgi:DNA-binding transcriptional MerR regulator
VFSIGDFAAAGRVSVRMLRHYDAIGLLVPAHTDPATGYRRYRVGQLSRLNRMTALKDLGFTLEQVARILDDKVSTEELHGMLRLRRAQLEAQLAADTARLAGVEMRLRMIEKEGRMSTEDVVLKEVPAVRVAELSAVADSYQPDDITPVIGPLYEQLMQRLDAAAVIPSGPPIAYYVDEDEAVRIHAAITVPEQVTGGDFDLLELPGLAHAATIVHRGDLAESMSSMQALAAWIDDNGWRPVGYAREVCLEFDPHNRANWVHELQLEVVRG